MKVMACEDWPGRCRYNWGKATDSLVGVCGSALHGFHRIGGETGEENRTGPELARCVQYRTGLYCTVLSVARPGQETDLEKHSDHCDFDDDELNISYPSFPQDDTLHITHYTLH